MPQLLDPSPMQLKDALTIIIAVLAVIFGLIQYRATSRDEFLRPIREAQLKLYQDASSAAATLATAQEGSEEWKKAKMNFLRLYYGPLAVVEDYRHEVTDADRDTITVERAMIAFKKQLDRGADTDKARLQNLSLALAHTCRVSLGSSWGFNATQLQGDYQKLIEESDPH